MIKTGIIAIDNGGYSTCVVTKELQEKFPSVKGYYGERNLVNTCGKNDFIIEYKGEKYVMGNLAKYDCKYPLQMHTQSKQNDFYDLSTLVAIHQYGYDKNYLIVSVPISMHNSSEKLGLVQRLLGDHTITVNGIKKTLTVLDVKVAPETASAWWVDKPYNKTKWLDIGSRTIGYASTMCENNRPLFIDTESGTLSGKGLEALDKDYNSKALADFICGKLLSIWPKDSVVYLLGGGSLDIQLVERIKTHFPKAIVMDNSQMVNAIGMYHLALVAFKDVLAVRK